MEEGHVLPDALQHELHDQGDGNGEPFLNRFLSTIFPAGVPELGKSWGLIFAPGKTGFGQDSSALSPVKRRFHLHSHDNAT
jgi:hypothetical protein